MPTLAPPIDPRVPRLLLVTRHAGALQWLRAELQAPQACHVPHLAVADGLQAGDTVAGNLPLELAAALCERGVVVLAIDLPLSALQRGQDLDAAAMQAAGARLRRYRVRAEPWPAGLTRAADRCAHERLQPAAPDAGRED